MANRWKINTCDTCHVIPFEFSRGAASAEYYDIITRAYVYRCNYGRRTRFIVREKNRRKKKKKKKKKPEKYDGNNNGPAAAAFVTLYFFKRRILTTRVVFFFRFFFPKLIFNVKADNSR